jgi:hypothetical protein
MKKLWKTKGMVIKVKKIQYSMGKKSLLAIDLTSD